MTQILPHDLIMQENEAVHKHILHDFSYSLKKVELLKYYDIYVTMWVSAGFEKCEKVLKSVC